MDSRQAESFLSVKAHTGSITRHDLLAAECCVWTYGLVPAKCSATTVIKPSLVWISGVVAPSIHQKSLALEALAFR